MFADTFVKLDVVLLIDVVLISKPESLISVDLLPLPHFSLYLLFLGLLLLLYFKFVLLSLFCLIGNNLFFDFLFLVEINREVDKLRVSSDQFGYFLSIQKLK